MYSKSIFQIGTLVLLVGLMLRVPNLIGWVNLNQGSIIFVRTLARSISAGESLRDDGGASQYFSLAIDRGVLNGNRNLGQALFELRRNAAARDAFAAFVKIFPQYKLGHLFLAQTFERLGDTNGMLLHLRQANAGTYLRTRAAAVGRAGNWRRAQEYLMQAVSVDPADGAAWFDLGQVNQILNRKHEAVTAYSNYLQAPDHDQFHQHVARAYVLRSNRDWQGAEQEYRAAFALMPLNPNPLKELGNMLLYDTKEYAKADQVLKLAVQVEPENMWLYIALGDLCRIRGQSDLAEQYYSFAKKIDPSSDAPDIYLQLNAVKKIKHNDP